MKRNENIDILVLPDIGISLDYLKYSKVREAKWTLEYMGYEYSSSDRFNHIYFKRDEVLNGEEIKAIILIDCEDKTFFKYYCSDTYSFIKLDITKQELEAIRKLCKYLFS